MTNATDASRATMFNQYVPASYSEYAFDYLDRAEYAVRLEEAKLRTIRIIRFHEVTLPGRGLCHEIRGLDGEPANLARYLNEKDGSRSDQARRQRELVQDIRLLTNKIRMPQNLKRRRSALFGGQDLPINIFEEFPSQEDVRQLVERIRLNIFTAAIKALIKDNEIEYVNRIWSLKVSVADEQRLAMVNRNTNRVKYDDRSFHGRPNRDRDR